MVHYLTIIYMYICVYLYRQIDRQIDRYIQRERYVHIIYIYICVHVYIYIYICIYIYVFIYMYYINVYINITALFFLFQIASIFHNLFSLIFLIPFHLHFFYKKHVSGSVRTKNTFLKLFGNNCNIFIADMNQYIQEKLF